MSHFNSFIASAVLLASTLPAMAALPDTSGQSIKLSARDVNINVGFYTPDIVRVIKTPAGTKTGELRSLVVVKTPETVNVKISNPDDSTVTMVSDALRVTVNTNTGAVSFATPSGSELLAEKGQGVTFTSVDDAGTPSYQVKSSFSLAPGEPIYGIGQVMDGTFNRRNTSYHLQNENMYTYSPYFISPEKGYAVYWDNYSISDFADTPEELTYTSLGKDLDYYFMYGKTPSGVIGCLRELTGDAPMLPLWAFGFFQSKERYQTAEEHLNILKRYRKLGVPIDCVIQDWRYWPEYNGSDSAWNSHSFDPQRYPDPKKWADDIHALNGKLMIVAWPGFGEKTKQYKDLKSKGMLIPFYTWPPNSGAMPYDVFNDEARDYYWKSLDNGIFSYIGNDGWWLDSTEPDHIERKDSDYDLPTARGSYRSVKNAYSLMHNEGIATHQKAQNKDKRVVILTRSGFIGQQRYGSNTWSGDVESSWESLKNHVPAAQHYAMMGIPNWNSDIGGFFAWKWRNEDGSMKEGFPELYVRWMQFGAFSPMMRSHGTDLPREIWQFGNRGDEMFDAQERMIRLRYRLLPYIYSTSWDVSAHDGLFIRPLLMDYGTDRKTYDTGNEYLFGKSLLIAPVTAPGVSEWDVYLPAGTKWWDFWTNKQYNGGQELKRPVTLDILPIFVPAGSILPFGPDVQYSTEKPWDNLEIRVYPGADGSFTLYEDENDNYNYENGKYSTIRFDWNQADNTLTIGKREGDFPGMLKSRKFNLVLVNGNSGTGDSPMQTTKTVTYSGKQIKIKL